jgi:arabinofuranosyltransferase
MSSPNWRIALLFLGAAAARLAFHALTGFTADDAFITFRYADNIAHGLGFVYNAGERVLGTSTPLFTFLLSITASIGIRPEHAALSISLIASGCTAVVLYRYAMAWRFAEMAWLPSVAYILWPRSIPSDSCGMETALFTAFCISALYYHQRNQSHWSLAFATLATATRIEGGILLLILLISECVRRRQQIFPLLIIPSAVLVPWMLFAWSYFGSPIPHSVSAKLALYSQLPTTSLFSQLSQVLGLHNLLSIPLWIAVIIGVYLIWRTRREGVVELVWLFLMIAIFAGSATHLFFWYMAPMAPVYLLFASAGVAIWVDRIPKTVTRAIWFAPAAIGLVTLALLTAWRTPITEFAKLQATMEECHVTIGKYLRVHAKESDLVAAEDIGYIGYLSGSRILDRDGLISPETVPYNRAGQYFDLITDYRPDWVVAKTGFLSPFLADSTIFKDYDLEKRFTAGETDYWVLKRK